jgi:hypothetical protein
MESVQAHVRIIDRRAKSGSPSFDQSLCSGRSIIRTDYENIGRASRFAHANIKPRRHFADAIREHLAIGRFHIGDAYAKRTVPASQSSTCRGRRDSADELSRRLAPRDAFNDDLIQHSRRFFDRRSLRLLTACSKNQGKSGSQ